MRQVLNFSTAPKRDTGIFALRNSQSPYINSSSLDAPSPGSYMPIQGGQVGKVASLLHQIKANDLIGYQITPQMPLYMDNSNSI